MNRENGNAHRFVKVLTFPLECARVLEEIIVDGRSHSKNGVDQSLDDAGNRRAL
jgi:hypothetical protein